MTVDRDRRPYLELEAVVLPGLLLLTLPFLFFASAGRFVGPGCAFVIRVGAALLGGALAELGAALPQCA